MEFIAKEHIATQYKFYTVYCKSFEVESFVVFVDRSVTAKLFQ